MRKVPAWRVIYNVLLLTGIILLVYSLFQTNESAVSELATDFANDLAREELCRSLECMSQ